MFSIFTNIFFVYFDTIIYNDRPSPYLRFSPNNTLHDKILVCHFCNCTSRVLIHIDLLTLLSSSIANLFSMILDAEFECHQHTSIHRSTVHTHWPKILIENFFFKSFTDTKKGLQKSYKYCQSCRYYNCWQIIF